MKVGYWKGKKLSEEHRKKLSEAHKGKKLPPFTEEHKRRIANAQNHEKSVHWKGDNVGYSQLHIYLRKYLPKPEYCQKCNNVEPRDLANITGIYNRDYANWMYLCVRCHLDLDKGLENIGKWNKGKTPWNKGRRFIK